ncbi:MAG: hypothetical protein EU532_03490 [Promethearchaeota archaeon]|nr:MAG: hypothetical protein EU532_03490 [Candidatus Lokiarchaeota archaeon]
MIICGNCGATNSDETSRFCRKCGALLPISSKPKRIRIPQISSQVQEGDIPTVPIKNGEDIKIKNKENASENHPPGGQIAFFASKSKKNKEANQIELNSIPQAKINSLSPPVIIETEELTRDLEEIPFESIEDSRHEKKEYLKEIKPKPFKGTIISSQKAYVPPITQTPQKASSASRTQDSKSEDSVLKQKRLEEDMLDVLNVLSKKLKVPKIEVPNKSVSKNKEAEEKIIPASMNEILMQILNLDTFIEASALIKRDGTILASALSNRISDSLFLTIGQNLSMIGNDIIEGLSAGKLNSISIRGTEGILDLAPIDKKISELKDIILMIFSHPRVKSGIIAFAVGIVRRQIKEYLGIK